MDLLLQYLRSTPQRQRVRPWALAPAILVLLVALPLLRPLRIPEPQDISSNELSRLAAVQAMAENKTQAIDQSCFYAVLQTRRSLDKSHQPPETVAANGSVFSDKPPVLAFILAGYYSVMMRLGLTMDQNPVLVSYLLTLLCSTMPVAAAAGLLYRMGRLFELPRPWRTGLAVAVTFGSGLISYAVVINAHAPAAALVIGACACVIHLGISKHQPYTGVWLMICGLCVSLATVIDLAAGVFLVGFVAVIITMRWRKRLRAGGLLMYAIGIMPPLILHAVLTVPITGDMLPPFLHPDLRPAARTISLLPVPGETEDEPAPENGWIHRVAVGAEKILGAMIGLHGMLSHFPVLIVGMGGIGLVLRRHWPKSTKAMALVTLLGGGLVVVTYVFRADWSQAMFGPRWFIVFLPLMLFWAGAWLRKGHHPITWTVAGSLLAFSVTVSLIGATDPFISAPPGSYTAAAAFRELIHPTPPAFNGAIVASGD